jgi:hypothetical protein
MAIGHSIATFAALRMNNTFAHKRTLIPLFPSIFVRESGIADFKFLTHLSIFDKINRFIGISSRIY